MDVEKIVNSVVGTLEGWGQSFVESLPNLVVGLILIVLFGVLGRFAGSGASSALRRMTKNVPISGLFGTVVKTTTWIFGLYLALRVLDLDETVTTLLAGVGVIGIALGFAFQDIAANFMSGFILALRRPFDIGDLVDVASIRGKVEGIDLRATMLETLDGLSIVIPNKEVFQNPIINYTKTKRRRAEVRVGVAYDSDLRQVEKTVFEALARVGSRDRSRDPEVFYEEFGGSSINLVGRVWLEDSHQLIFLRAISEAIVEIKDAFDEAQVVIPFPIRTLDFGADDVGGKRIELQDALRSNSGA